MDTIPAVEVEVQHLSGQEVRSDLGESLSSADRRTLLTASLSLFLRRLRHNLPLWRDDLTRLIPLLDERPTTDPSEMVKDFRAEEIAA